MLDFFGTGVLGSLLGGLFRLAPEVLKLLDKKNERAHELAMFTLQTDLEKMRGEFRMEEKYVDHSTAALDAIQEAFKQQGEADAKAWKWVASMSALVRPGVTYWFMALYSAAKFATIWIAYRLNQGMAETLQQAWTEQDFGLLSMILTFWFVGRAIEKYKK
jgi:hypothetical protein